MRCPKCKTNWEPGTAVCEVCGIDLKAPRPKSKAKSRQATKTTRREKDSRRLIWGVVGVTLGGLGLLIQLIKASQGGLPGGNGAYNAGVVIGICMLFLMLAGGIYYLITA